jgi:hypothetical protein
VLGFETEMEAERNDNCIQVVDEGSEDDCLEYTGSPMDQEMWCDKCKAHYRVFVTISIRS